MSWHADSSLEHFSSIAVYHTTSRQGAGAGAGETPVSVPTKKSRGVTPACSPEDEGGGEGHQPDASWRVALRVWPNAEGPTAGKPVPPAVAVSLAPTDPLMAPPYVAVPLLSGSTYFLLDDFNHHHQHAGV